MAKVGIDFGTGNTVVAVFNETRGHAETLEIPGISTAMRYRTAPGSPEHVVHVVPSLIHYSETETLIGDQVLSRGLAEHKDTFRWMKRAIGQANTKRRKTTQGHKCAADAGTDFLTILLRYASDRLSLEDDEFTFTAPTEAFETYQDWLRTNLENLGVRRFRMLDEPTACVLGYHGAARRDDHFAVFDFGCGTLDVSIVKVDLGSAKDRKASQIGQAGRDLGGMDLDQWIAADFCQRHGLDEATRREYEALILRQAEAAKITLSDAATDETEMTVLVERNGVPRVLKTQYRRSCPACERGKAGTFTDASESCFGCLLLGNEFLKHARETLDRALENAAVKAGVRRDGITKLLATGGTSLVPCVGKMLQETFNGRVEFQSPFDAVARGACRGTILPILQHDYAIESYNKERKDYEFMPLFKIGADYPTAKEKPVKLWGRGGYGGQVRIGLKIFEVSRMKRRQLDVSMVDESGTFLEVSKVASEFSFICLNPDNPTFILADPPYDEKRDGQRFLCSFRVDEQRRLVVTVVDKFYNTPEFVRQNPQFSPLGGKPLFVEHPVVRL
jgi:molecular chaperone DnaK (HSP70)